MDRPTTPFAQSHPAPEGPVAATAFRADDVSGAAASVATPRSNARQAPPLRARHDGWTPKRQSAFLDAVGDGACIAAAARAVGMSRESAYRLRRNPCAAGFAARWAAIDAAHAARPTLAELLDDPVNAEASDAAAERWLDARLARPDSTRFIIRRLSAAIARSAKRADR